MSFDGVARTTYLDVTIGNKEGVLGGTSLLVSNCGLYSMRSKP